MLVLTRRTGEKIRIGKDITVAVMAVNRNQIRLGISAPRDIPVHREEIYQRILKERKEQKVSMHRYSKLISK